jgi:hypothetical protein
MASETGKPKARKDDLVVQSQGEETLVYDNQSHHAHCLTRLAALIWQHCDGRRNVAELATIAHKQLGTPADTQIVEVALQELGQANLLEGYTSPAGSKGLSRRELAARLGAGAAAFLLAPLVTSIRTQPAMAAASPAPGTTTATTATTATTVTTRAPTTTSVTAPTTTQAP